MSAENTENMKKAVSILFFCLFVFSLIFTVWTKFDEISLPYFKGIRRSVQTDVIFYDKETKVFYDNDIAEVKIKVNDKHFLFGKKTYKKVSKISFEDKALIKELSIYNGFEVKKYEQIPDSIKVNNEKNIVEKASVAFLSFFYNYKLFLLSYLFLILVFTCAQKSQSFSFFYFKLNPKNHGIIFIVITLLAILSRIVQINEIPFWDDEIYIITHTDKNAALIEMFLDPGNPPLYFIIFKIWSILVPKEEFYRYLSVIIGILFNIAFYYYIRIWLNRSKALAAYFMCAISLILIYFSQEIRCYVLLMLFAVLSSILLFKYKSKNNKKLKILYFINSVLLLNTHFYGTFIWLFNFIFGISILYKKNRYTKKFDLNSNLFSFVLNNVLAFIVFIPNVIFKSKSLSSAFNTWIQVPEFGDFIQVLKNFSVSMAVFVLFVCTVFYLYKKTKSKKTRLFLKYNILIIICVIAFSFIFSYLIKPIFAYRYFYSIYPFYLALCVWAVCFEYKTKMKFFLSFVFFILFSTTGRLNTQNLYNNSNLYFNFTKQAVEQNIKQNNKKKLRIFQ